MKIILLVTLLFGSAVYGQTGPNNKNTVTIEGQVKERKIYFYDELKRFPSLQIDSLQIYSHTMAFHGVTRNIKGVLLKDILKEVEIESPSPKLLSEFYIVCLAADNYKVVFSWNEIFNNATGDKVMIALEKDGRPAFEHKDGITLVTPTDRATGRRFVKELNKIVIQRVN